MTGLRIFLAAVALLVLPDFASAQDETDSGDQAQPQAAVDNPFAAKASETPPDAGTEDPVTALEGIWRVDRTEGAAAASGALMGRMFRISRSAVPSLTAGTCTNPLFAVSGKPPAATVEITCLGQKLASAAWDPTAPDTVNWSETDLQAVLHRIARKADLDAAAAGGNSSSQSGDGQ